MKRGANGHLKEAIWTITYRCHRAGTKQFRNWPLGGQSGKPRPIQKASKKIDCPARLRVTYTRQNCNHVKIELTSGENNDCDACHHHVPGSLGDARFLPLSHAAKERARCYLVDGFRLREVRTGLRRIFLDAGDRYPMRDKMIHGEDVYDLYRSVQGDFIRKSDDQKESVRLWLVELEQQQFRVFVHPTYGDSFSFGFMAPWQNQILKESNAFCLDATHGVTDFHGDAKLYTIVVRHRDTGAGCLVAFFFTLDKSAKPLSDWLLFVRQNTDLNPAKITTDCSWVEVQALRHVFRNSLIQWCVFSCDARVVEQDMQSFFQPRFK